MKILDRNANVIHEIDKDELSRHTFNENFSSVLSLKNAVFDNLSLEGCFFTDTYLAGASFKNCDLYWSCFYETNLENTDFSGADLCACDFKNANLSGANLSNANFSFDNLGRAAQLQGANLSRIIICNTNLLGAVYSATTIFPHNFIPEEHGMVLIRGE